jgi:hypothetical protein
MGKMMVYASEDTGSHSNPLSILLMSDYSVRPTARQQQLGSAQPPLYPDSNLRHGITHFRDINKKQHPGASEKKIRAVGIVFLWHPLGFRGQAKKLHTAWT